MKLRTLLFSGIASVAIAAFAAAAYRPARTGAYYSSDGSGNDGTWLPMAGSGGVGAAVGRVAHSGLYYSSDGSGNDGTWLPCGPSCFGSGSGTVNSGTLGQLAYYAANGTAVSGTNALPNTTTATVGTSTGSIAAAVFKQAPTTTPPVGATTVFTTPAGSGQVYRICTHVIITTAGTSGGVFPALTYTSVAHTFSGLNFTQTGVGISGGTLAVAAQWNHAAGCYTFSADAATNIQAWLGLGGVTGTPAYSYDATLERLQ
jgi:hypothetical protein